ncbi:uncharacterized protein BX663DRAFT_431217, partial [Cokeromyces recurvatus]|uniref:uncharacterized protein n=1 Tax=Cokeromyces recurvatus TaxID=90255 RepID=UPI002220A978
LAKQHAIHCLEMYCKLKVPETIINLMPFLLKHLPSKKLQTILLCHFLTNTMT